MVLGVIILMPTSVILGVVLRFMRVCTSPSSVSLSGLSDLTPIFVRESRVRVGTTISITGSIRYLTGRKVVSLFVMPPSFVLRKDLVGGGISCSQEDSKRGGVGLPVSKVNYYASRREGMRTSVIKII